MSTTRKTKRKNNKIIRHLRKVGFTNRLAVYMLLFLFFGLVGGFYLGIISIENQYMGSLLCWTVVFTPIGTATSIAISKVVDKSKAENTVGGIKYETAMIDVQSENYVDPDDLQENILLENNSVDEYNIDSPQL